MSVAWILSQLRRESQDCPPETTGNVDPQKKEEKKKPLGGCDARREARRALGHSRARPV